MKFPSLFPRSRKKTADRTRAGELPTSTGSDQQEQQKEICPGKNTGKEDEPRNVPPAVKQKNWISALSQISQRHVRTSNSSSPEQSEAVLAESIVLSKNLPTVDDGDISPDACVVAALASVGDIFMGEDPKVSPNVTETSGAAIQTGSTDGMDQEEKQAGNSRPTEEQEHDESKIAEDIEPRSHFIEDHEHISPLDCVAELVPGCDGIGCGNRMVQKDSSPKPACEV